MKSIQRTLAICVFTFSASAFAANNNEPAYNPASPVDIDGTIAAVRQIPKGSALEGVHLTVKTKSAVFDVYLGPAAFMRIFKTDFRVGDEVEVSGSKVKFGAADVILTREVAVGGAVLTLRDGAGAPDWKNWGVEINPAQVH